MEELRIGVIGYSKQEFDKSVAVGMIRRAYDVIDNLCPERTKAVVSGLTDVGIPALAYREAVARGWRTIGIACSKAEKYECFPVDEKIIEGSEWGQESPRFIESIDVLVRVGGGDQSVRETAECKKRGMLITEHDLPAQ